MDNMVPCATLDGAIWMHLWSADSLASLLMVRDIHVIFWTNAIGSIHFHGMVVYRVVCVVCCVQHWISPNVDLKILGLWYFSVL